MFTTLRGYGHAIIRIGFMLAASALCFGSPITYIQLQESALVTGFATASYDSGQINQFQLMHAIGVPSLNTVLAGATGLISGNDITGQVVAQSGQASLTASWLDGITVTGLAPGTRVSVLITNSLTSHVLVQGNGSASVQSNLRLFLGNPLDLTLFNSNTNTHNNTQTLSHLVDLFSGDPAALTLVETLTLNVNSAGIQAEADAPGDVFIDVMTPGATLISARGVNYSSTAATPEPGSFGLLALGSFGLVVVRRMRDAARL